MYENMTKLCEEDVKSLCFKSYITIFDLKHNYLTSSDIWLITRFDGMRHLRAYDVR